MSVLFVNFIAAIVSVVSPDFSEIVHNYVHIYDWDLYSNPKYYSISPEYAQTLQKTYSATKPACHDVP
jgi:hypothetical protein